MIKVAIADPDVQFKKDIEMLIESRPDMLIVASARSLNHALALADEQQIDVMVIGPGMGADISIPFIKKLTAKHPVGCILLAFNKVEQLKMAANKANAVDVLQAPVDPDKLIGAIHVAAGYAQQLSLRDNSFAADRKCAVITVFSTKGGVGKTVLSTNVATAIAKQTGGRVVLVDLDLQFGDVGIALGLRPEKTILDYIDGMAEADSTRIDELLTRYEGGLNVILAPKEPESADLITGQSVSSMISGLKKFADFIVVDTPASFNDNVLAVLDESDEICLILTLDLLSVKNTKLCLRTLHELRYGFDKYRMVVNRVESNVGLKVSEIEKVLRMKAIASISTDKAVPLSVNKAVPVVLDAPKLQVSKEIEGLAQFYINKHRPDLISLGMAG